MRRERYKNIDELNILDGRDFKHVETLKSNNVSIFIVTSKDNKIEYFCIGKNKKRIVCFVEKYSENLFSFKYNVLGTTREKLFKRQSTAQRYAFVFCKKYIEANFIRA